MDEFDPNAMLGVAMFGLSNELDPTFTDPRWLHRFQPVDRLGVDQRPVRTRSAELDLHHDAPGGAVGRIRTADRPHPALLRTPAAATVSPVYGLDLAALCLND